MKTVHVSASRGYDVHIGPGLLDTLGTQAAAVLKGRKVCVVSDDTVAALCLERAKTPWKLPDLPWYPMCFPMERPPSAEKIS